jgi:hypothetical protein
MSTDSTPRWNSASTQKLKALVTKNLNITPDQVIESDPSEFQAYGKEKVRTHLNKVKSSDDPLPSSSSSTPGKSIIIN